MTTSAFDVQGKSRFIPLSLQLVGHRGVESVRADLRRILRSTRFEISEDADAFRLLGPDAPYHAFDPYLEDALKAFGSFPATHEILSYRREGLPFDLCFEDSWSGYFIANCLVQQAEEDDLVLVHADDHTDMMSTRLVLSAKGLMNPAMGGMFDPQIPSDWEAAIAAGCVGIGDFLTPLYYGQRRMHVRHISNALQSGLTAKFVSRCAFGHDLIPHVEFAGLSLVDSSIEGSAGTYISGRDAHRVLSDLPPGRVVVHIDLDYFINDFNGNPDGHSVVSDSVAHSIANEKLDRLFDSLRSMARAVDRWIVGTSPGFCSARHWESLLDGIEKRIGSGSRAG